MLHLCRAELLSWDRSVSSTSPKHCRRLTFTHLHLPLIKSSFLLCSWSQNTDAGVSNFSAARTITELEFHEGCTFSCFMCYQSAVRNLSSRDPGGSPQLERTLSASISTPRQACARMFFLTSFIKPALCFSLIVSRREKQPDKHHQHPSM